MKLFKNLTVRENKALLNFPVYISLLAADKDSTLDEEEKIAVVKLSHTATFACDPILTEFYAEADKVFEMNMEQLNKNLPKDLEIREAIIKKELLNLEKIVLKLGKEFTLTMQQSMKVFKEHVSKAHHNVLVDFIFPVAIPGLTDG